MKSRRFTTIRRKGFTLTETIIALGTIGMALPLTMAAMVMAGQTGSRSEAETTAAIVARSLRANFQKLRLEEPITYLSASAEGGYISEMTEADYRLGVSDREAHFLVVIQELEIPKPSELEGLQIELKQRSVEITYPSHLPLAKRRIYKFSETLR